MEIYLINLDRRPDRLAAMTQEAGRAGLSFTRLTALDAATAGPAALDGWFAPGGPLGPLPLGDRCCTLSHRRAWAALVASGAPHAAVLEDDVRLGPGAGPLLGADGWLPDDVDLLKLEHYGPRGQRILVTDMRPLTGVWGSQDFSMARLASRHTGAAAYVISRRAAERLLAVTRFDLPVDHLLFNPNNSPLFARLRPWQLIPAVARQQEFVGAKSDIEGTRKAHRAFDLAYVKRELIRFGYDLKLVPRQLALLAGGKTATLNVPCQATDKSWSVTVPFSGVKAGIEVDAEATIVDNYLRATADARLIAHTAFIKADPTASVAADGTITLSGTYGCSDTENGDVVVEVNQIQAGGAAAIGVAAFTVACPATNAPWSANVAMARIPISSTNPTEQSFELTWGDGRARVLSSGELG